ncbi:MAG TPA: carboxypeptidase-like regulatory domain-containing protein [Limnochordia bacterium]|nr:carboxypeptidase-like regulatory domain-containing protein [Limnochordia bacterium]
MRKKLCLGLIVVVALALSGCFSFLFAEYDITGVVTDFDGNPLEGVLVAADTDPAVSAETDAEGKFTLTGLKGSVKIAASKEGYLFTGPLTVTKKEAVEIKGVEGIVEKTGEGSVRIDLSEDGTATLTATAAQGWLFARWTGDVDSRESSVTVELDGPLAVTALFIDPQTDEGYMKWNHELIWFPEYWEQLYGREGFEYEVADGTMWIKMASQYCYAGMRNVLIPTTAVTAKVVITETSDNITKHPWRLRIVDTAPDPDEIYKVAGGGVPTVGEYEAALPAEVITLIQAGTPLQIELGGAWDQDEWAKFYVEFLDAEGNPVTY